MRLTPDQQRLVADNVGLAYRIAGRAKAAWPVEDYDALLSDAQYGLCRAGLRYDPSLGVPFAPYAIRRIIGEIQDGKRNRDNLARSMRRKINELDRARDEFAQEHLRLPTDEELASLTQLTVAEVTERRMNARNGTTDVLDDVIADPRASEDFEEVFRQAEDPELAAAVAQLPEKERFVVALRFWNDLTLREIGEVMGVTESRISQLLTSALGRLRAVPA